MGGLCWGDIVSIVIVMVVIVQFAKKRLQIEGPGLVILSWAVALVVGIVAAWLQHWSILRAAGTIMGAGFCANGGYDLVKEMVRNVGKDGVISR